MSVPFFFYIYFTRRNVYTTAKDINEPTETEPSSDEIEVDPSVNQLLIVVLL